MSFEFHMHNIVLPIGRMPRKLTLIEEVIIIM